MQDLSLYIHYPFCVLKCPYCDFNSHVREKIDISAYIDAYRREIAFFAKRVGKRRIKTIFFGGGTPSLMPHELVVAILDAVAKNFTIIDNVEISLEANPSSVENKNLFYLKEVGINRLSLGIQSLQDADLKFLGRAHNSNEAKDAIKVASELFSNFSLDFIYTLPQQELEVWLKNLEEIFSFNSQHLSLYQLTIEKGTRFYKQYKDKEFVLPNNDDSALFYSETSKLCEAQGYKRYEVSNYAKDGYQCQHNLTYWNYDEYLGIGAGAHSRVSYQDANGLRELMNIHSPEKWLNSVLEKGNALQNDNLLSASLINEEKLMLGLRKQSGVSLDGIQINKKKLKLLVEEGLIKEDGNIIRASDNGILLLNSLIAELLEV